MRLFIIITMGIWFSFFSVYGHDHDDRYLEKYPIQPSAMQMVRDLRLPLVDTSRLISVVEEQWLNEKILILLSTSEYCGHTYGFRNTRATPDEESFLKEALIHAAGNLYFKPNPKDALSIVTQLWKKSAEPLKNHIEAVRNYLNNYFSFKPTVEPVSDENQNLNKKTISLNNPVEYFHFFMNYKPTEDSLLQKNCDALYLLLWSLAGVKGADYVKQNYSWLIDLLHSRSELYDVTLKTPITRFGFFSNLMTKVVRPLNSAQTTLIFGKGRKDFKNNSTVYTVHITPHSDPDLLADMNNPEQLRSLPDNHFEKIMVKDVPALEHYNSEFFKSMKRILKPKGQLILKVMKYMEEEPYQIVPEVFFSNNGFRLISTNYIEEMGNALSWVLEPIP